MVGFIFGGEGLPKTPQELARLRAMAQAVAPSRAPKDVGEGLNAVGNAILYRSLMGKANKAEAAGTASANDAFSTLFGKPTVDASGFPFSPSTGAVAPSGPVDMTGNDVFSGFMDTVKAGGVTNPYALAAIAATGKRESGFSPKNVNRTWSDPSESGQPGTAGGIMSWRGPRYEALAATGDLSPQGQAKFFLQEDPQLIARLNAANSVEEAQRMMNEAWKFAGWDRPGGEAAARISAANSFLPIFQQGTGAVARAPVAASAPGGLPPSAAPGTVARAPDGQTYQMAETTGMAGATGSQGWIPVNAGAVERAPIDAPQGMAARMAPGGAPMVQGRAALVQALMQQRGATPAAQAIEQTAPQQVDPRAQFGSPQLNAADPKQGVLQAILAQGGPQGQPAPQSAPMGGPGLDMNKAIELMNNPFLDPGKKAVLGAMLERQMQAQDPVRQMQLEKGKLEIEQLRNPAAKPTDDMREYEFAKSQGFQGSYLDFQTSLKKAGAASTNINMGEGDKFYENLDKKNAETFSALSDAGMQARSKLAQVDRLEGLLATAPQGASALLKQAAGEYGINTEGLSDIQASQALINELVPQQRQPGSGPMSDADLALFKQSLPRLINQPEGNKAIIDTMRGIAQYQVQMGEIADAVANREMTPAQGRKAIQSLKNPLEGFGKLIGGQTPASDNDGWQEITPGVRVRRMD